MKPVNRNTLFSIVICYHLHIVQLVDGEQYLLEVEVEIHRYEI